MTTDEKWEDAERSMGYPCGVLTCPCNVNGFATCGDYHEDHCFKRLYHDTTDPNFIKFSQRSPRAFGEEPLVFLEPWVKESDISSCHQDATLVRLRFCAGD